MITNKMLKKDLVDAVYKKVNAEYIESNKLKNIVLTKGRLEEVVTETFDIIVETLEKGEDVKLLNFGTFGVRERVERQGHNPKTKEKLIIPASKVPYFKACKDLKKRVDK